MSKRKHLTHRPSVMKLSLNQLMLQRAVSTRFLIGLRRSQAIHMPQDTPLLKFCKLLQMKAQLRREATESIIDRIVAWWKLIALVLPKMTTLRRHINAIMEALKQVLLMSIRF